MEDIYFDVLHVESKRGNVTILHIIIYVYGLG